MSTEYEYYSEETGEIIATDASDNASLHSTLQVNPANWRPAGVVNLNPQLVERGKIKIGMKGAARQSKSGGSYQMPVKLDHFLVTTSERGEDGNFTRDSEIMGMLGENPREIPVTLIYDDIALNFPTRYAMYEGRQLKCTGDGQQARWNDRDGARMVQCPCPRQNPDYAGKDKCKINGTLSVIITGADVIGGAWKLRTTSYNSVVGLLSSMAMIKRVSGGVLAGIPLVLKVSPKAATSPDGKQQTIYVVSLEYRGSVQSLQNIGYNVMLQHKQHGVRIEQLEQQARILIASHADEYQDESDDIVSEFYPEQQEGYSANPKPTDTTNRPRTFAHLGGQSNVPQQPRNTAPQQDVSAKPEPKQQQRPVIEHGAEPDFDLF